MPATVSLTACHVFPVAGRAKGGRRRLGYEDPMVRLYPEKADSSSIMNQTAEMGGQVDCRSTPVDSECQYSAGGGLQRGSQVIEVLGRRAFGRQDSVVHSKPSNVGRRVRNDTCDDRKKNRPTLDKLQTSKHDKGHQ